MKQLSIEKSKRFFIGLALIYLAAMTFIFVSSSYARLNNGIILKATSYAKGISTYKHSDIPGHGYFISGMTGDLYWKPKTLTESMILATINNKGGDIFDLAGLSIMALIIYYMFKDSKTGAVFTKTMSLGFLYVIFALQIIGTLGDFGRMLLAIHYLPSITGGLFKGDYDFKVISFNYLIFALLIFLVRIPNSGLELQKESELTI